MCWNGNNMGYTELNEVLALISPVSFYFYNMSTRKLQII